MTKTKLTGRITCCAWSADGQLLAFGLYNGQVHVRDKVTIKKMLVKKFTFVFRKETKNINSIEVMQQILLYGMFHGVQLGKIRMR